MRPALPLYDSSKFTTNPTSSITAIASTSQPFRSAEEQFLAVVPPPSAPRLSASNGEIGFSPNMNQQQASFRDRGPCARVELMLSAKALADKDVFSKSDPICVVEEFVARGRPGSVQNVFVEIGRTECIKNCLNPKWNKRIRMDFFFERKQLLRFSLYDIDSESDQLSQHDFLGRCECELADIVAAPNGIHQLHIKDLPNQHGVLMISAEELDEGQRETVYFACRAFALRRASPWRACFFNGPNTFLEFYNLLNDGTRQMVHRTEVAKCTRNPGWKPFEISLKRLCDGNKEKDFLVECYDQREASGNHHLIGSVQCSITLFGLASSAGDQFELRKVKKGRRMSRGREQLSLNDSASGAAGNGHSSAGGRGMLHFMEMRVFKEYTFLDYIKAGLQLEFAVAVDLTASNGVVTDPRSLHYVNSIGYNQYQCAICAVLEICEKYNHSKQFEALGFGAKIPPEYVISHLFPLNLYNSKRTVTGVPGVLDAYQHAISHTELYGPTYFAPLIQEYFFKCQNLPRNGTRYQVLLILTDGVIMDMQKTVDAIIGASQQPLSIIIIGIGNEDFSKMEFLDSDDQLLTQNGKSASRDIVQFVPFREFIGPRWATTHAEQLELKKMLAREVLVELPAQVCSFMKANSIAPVLPRCFPAEALPSSSTTTSAPSTAQYPELPSPLQTIATTS